MRYLAFLFVLPLGACATSPVSVQHASSVSSSHFLAPQWASPSPNTGLLIVTRDSGLMGAGCAVRLYVDAIPAADLEASEKVELFIEVGEHVVGVTPRGICGGGTASTEVVVRADRQKVLRIGSGQSGDLTIQPSAF